jgi:crossover junction endodeoxyribonuclease RusA
VTTLPRIQWEVPLPYTSPPLRENDRLHWAKRARLTAQIRRDTAWAVRAAKVPRMDRAVITLHWQPAVRRRRDVLGASPTLKAAVDGVVDAGVLADDDATRCVPGCCLHDPRKGEPGRVWLTIIDAKAAP